MGPYNRRNRRPARYLAAGPNLGDLPVNPTDFDSRRINLLIECGYTHILRPGHLKTELSTLAVELE